MEKVIFGKTGIAVSPITLGTWGIGGAGWDEYPDDVRLDTIKAAVEAGINLIDTAPAYNGGKSEQYIGKALEEIGAQKRSRVEGNVKCLNWKLTEEEMEILDAAIREKIGR